MTINIDDVLNKYGKWCEKGDDLWNYNTNEWRDNVFIDILSEDRHELTKKYFNELGKNLYLHNETSYCFCGCKSINNIFKRIISCIRSCKN